MRLVMSAAAITLGLGMIGASARPMIPAPETSQGLVIRVQQDCHAEVRRHYLPELDRREWHRHRPNCRVVVVEPEDDRPRDCHEEVRRHYLPEFERRVLHRHRPNCRVVIVERDEDRDCHREVQRHYLPEYGGRVTHRHVGQNCRIRAYSRYDDDRRGRNCVQLGPITYCER